MMLGDARVCTLTCSGLEEAADLWQVQSGACALFLPESVNFARGFLKETSAPVKPESAARLSGCSTNLFAS